MGMNNRLLRPRVSGAFSPLRISGLAAWWDANDSSTITVDSGVTAWRDKVNAISCAQAVGNLQPEYRTASINGKNSVYFGGTTFLLSSANSAMNVTDLTFMCVFRADDARNAGVVNKSGLNITPDGFGVYTRTNGEVWFQGDDALTAWTTTTPAVSVQSLSLAVCRGTGSQQSLRVNGTEATVRNGAATFSANVGMRVGQRRVSTEFFLGHVCEILVWSRVISATEELQVRQFLQTKWGLSVI